MTDYKFGQFEMEVVDWLDHARSGQSQEWYGLEATLLTARIPCAIRSIGFLIGEDEEQIVLAPEQRGDPDQTAAMFNPTITILKGTILKRSPLRVSSG